MNPDLLDWLRDLAGWLVCALTFLAYLILI